MLIASQKELVFSHDDQTAMDARLNTYKFVALSRPDPKAYEWLRNHPVDCIVWAIQNCREREQSPTLDPGKYCTKPGVQ